MNPPHAVGKVRWGRHPGCGQAPTSILPHSVGEEEGLDRPHMSSEVNLNSDLGESFGPWKMGADGEMLAIVRSANVACGYHASGPMVMAETVRLAVKNGVSIGAHPGFPDLQGFGRRVMRFTNAEIEM